MKSHLPSVITASALVLSLVSGMPVARAAPDESIISVDSATARQSFEQSLMKAERGDAQAQYDVARSYQTGMGVVPDSAKAVEWLNKAAEQGLVAAETSLGSAYDAGMGVPLSNQKAVYWWQRAARHGSDYALRCLGYAYIEGRGVAQNNLHAYVVWKQLPSGDAEAESVLQALRKNLSAEEITKGDELTLDDVFNSQ